VNLFNLEEAGLAGIFLLSLIANSIPFVGLPYLVAVAVYAANYGNPLLVGVVSGLGAAVGKVIIYLIPTLSRRFISEDTKERLDAFRKLAERYLFFVILLFAASPLPDDVLYIPVGFMGYDLLRYFIACAIGKVILTATLCIFSKGYMYVMTEYMGLNNIASSIILTIICILGTYILTKIDWIEVAKIANDRGLKEAFIFSIEKYLVKRVRK